MNTNNSKNQARFDRLVKTFGIDSAIKIMGDKAPENVEASQRGHERMMAKWAADRRFAREAAARRAAEKKA